MYLLLYMFFFSNSYKYNYVDIIVPYRFLYRFRTFLYNSKLFVLLENVFEKICYLSNLLIVYGNSISAMINKRRGMTGYIQIIYKYASQKCIYGSVKHLWKSENTRGGRWQHSITMKSIYTKFFNANVFLIPLQYYL